MEHTHVSRLYVQIGPGHEDIVRASVQNKPEMPDIEGRQDVPPSAVPDQGDKEIVSMYLDVIAGATVPGDEFPAVQIGRFADAPFFGGDSTPPNTHGVGHFEDHQHVRWWPDVDSSRTDDRWIDLPEPIQWPDQDLIHLRGRWNDTNHSGITIEAHLHWRHV